MIVVTYFRSSGRSGLLYKQITCAGPDISSERLPSDHKNRLQILIVLTEVAVGLWSSRGVWQCGSVRVLPARDNWELRQPLQWAAAACVPQLTLRLSVCLYPPAPPGPGNRFSAWIWRWEGGRREEGGEGARSWSLIFFTTSSSYHWQSSFLRLPGEQRQAGLLFWKKGRFEQQTLNTNFVLFHVFVCGILFAHVARYTVDTLSVFAKVWQAASSSSSSYSTYSVKIRLSDLKKRSNYI